MTTRPQRPRRRGFTLVEVLATVMLIAIVLPAVNQAMVSAASVADLSRHRTEAGGLAQSKVAELITSGQWQGGILSGDFGTDWPGYQWHATANAWADDQEAVGMSQLDVTVTWPSRGATEQVVASGLVYVRPTATTTN